MGKKKQDEKSPEENTTEAFELAMREGEASGTYVLRLFVAGTTPNSRRAIENVRKICEEHLKGRYELEIIDIYQQPLLAKEGQIVAAPTLVKNLPPPLRKFIGDMSNKEKILLGLDMLSKKKPSDSKENG
jgi:circadian clock protein KaiB